MKQLQNRSSLSRGFTVVELLVVIVVIGVLSGITVMAYGAWRDDTDKTVLESDLRGAATVMKQRLTSDGTYPSVLSSDDFKRGDGVTINVRSANKKFYCLEATLAGSSLGTYMTSSVSAQPTAGVCTSTKLPPPVIDYADHTYCFYYPPEATSYMSGMIRWSAVPGASRYRIYVGGVFVTEYTTVPATGAYYELEDTWSAADGITGGVVKLTMRAVDASGVESADSSVWEYKVTQCDD